jgi:hypothetical protein
VPFTTRAGEAGVRRRVVAAGLALVGLLLTAFTATGCDQEAAAGTNGRQPAATAGRACQLIEYDIVSGALGTQFDTAGGAQQGDTYSCVLGMQGHPYPDLTFAMSPTTVSPLLYSVSIAPAGSTAVDQLGVSAYQLIVPPGTAADGTASGQGLELGWLSARQVMLLLRYTFPADAGQPEIEKIATGLIALAKQIDEALSKL